MKDYDLTIQYHPGKANIVADALSWKSGGSLAALLTGQLRLLRDLEEMQIDVKLNDSSSILSQLNQEGVRFDLYDEIKESQQGDSQLMKIWEKVQKGGLQEFNIKDDMLRFEHRLCVPEIAEIKERIMKEAHSAPYTAHPGSTKIYQDLRHNFWWDGMKKDITEFV